GAGSCGLADQSMNAPLGDDVNCAFPGRLREPGPGRSAVLSRAMLPVGGMQKLLTSTDGCGRLSLRSPDGEPVCWIASALVNLNAPGVFCDGQKFPSAAVTMLCPVVSGVRFTGSVARNVPSLGGQSRVVSALFTVVHGSPWLFPKEQAPSMHCGHAVG